MRRILGSLILISLLFGCSEVVDISPPVSDPEGSIESSNTEVGSAPQAYVFEPLSVPDLDELLVKSLAEQEVEIPHYIELMNQRIEENMVILSDDRYTDTSKEPVRIENKQLGDLLSQFVKHLPVLEIALQEEVLRLEMEELRSQIVDIEVIEYIVQVEARVKLPSSVTLSLKDGSVREHPVTWEQLFVEQSTAGTALVQGKLMNLEGLNTTATVNYVQYPINININNELKYEGNVIDIYYTENDRPIVSLLGTFLDEQMQGILTKYQMAPNTRQTLYLFPNFDSMVRFTEQHYNVTAPPNSYGMGVSKGKSAMISPLLPTPEGYGFDYDSFFRVALHEMVHGLHMDIIQVSFDRSDIAVREGAATFMAANEPLFRRVVDYLLENPPLSWSQLNSRTYRLDLPYGANTPYSVGHILMYYLELEYGSEAITNFLTYNDYERAFGVSKQQVLDDMYVYIEENTQTFYDYSETWHTTSLLNIEEQDWPT
jgi:hypothetical protein